MDELQEKIYDCLCSISGEQVTNAFINYYGTQLLDSDFAKYLVEEGFMEVEDEDEEDDY